MVFRRVNEKGPQREVSYESTRQGAIQIAPSRRGRESPNDWRGDFAIRPIDPCGRTYPSKCDHKGRMVVYTSFPPVFGSTSLDRGLSEWHPSGCSYVIDGIFNQI